MDNIVLISIPKDELRSMIKQAVNEELSLKKEKEILSFREIQELLGVSSSALNGYMRTGKVPYKKLGKRILFNRLEVLTALKESNFKKFRDLL